MQEIETLKCWVWKRKRGPYEKRLWWPRYTAIELRPKKGCRKRERTSREYQAPNGKKGILPKKETKSSKERELMPQVQQSDSEAKPRGNENSWWTMVVNKSRMASWPEVIVTCTRAICHNRPRHKCHWNPEDPEWRSYIWAKGIQYLPNIKSRRWHLGKKSATSLEVGGIWSYKLIQINVNYCSVALKIYADYLRIWDKNYHHKWTLQNSWGKGMGHRFAW